MDGSKAVQLNKDVLPLICEHLTSLVSTALFDDESVGVISAL